MADDFYTVDAQGRVAAGKFLNLPVNGIASGGTVANLAADVSASGFTLLTTAPANTIYRNAPHAGMAWDETRKVAWIFGAETHSIAADYDNSVYAFDTSDGLFKKIYEKSTWPGEYNINDDGYLYADDAETLPYAAHVYQRVRYDAATKSLIVPYDTEFHSFTTPIQKGAITLSNRKKAIWRYNTDTNVWTTEHNAGIQSFLGGGTINGLAYSNAWGYVQCPSPFFQRLSNEGVFTQTNVSGLSSSQYHDSCFIVGDYFFKFCGNENTYLFSKHLISNPTDSLRMLVADFPALTGWSITNKSATLTGDGDVLFMATSGASIGAFIYSISGNAVTDTGYRLNGFTQSSDAYDFKLCWSAGLNGAVYLTRMFGTVRAYLLRL